MKKITTLLFLFITFQLFSGSFKLELNEIDRTYIKETLGKPFIISFKAKYMSIIDQGYVFQALGSRYKESEEARKLQTKFVDEFEFDKFVLFNIKSFKPIAETGLDIKVELINAKNESVAYPQIFIPIEVKNINDGSKTYLYYWILEPYKLIVKENYPDDELPLKMIITFPGHKMKIYRISM